MLGGPKFDLLGGPKFDDGIVDVLAEIEAERKAGRERPIDLGIPDDLEASA
ncbi:MAG TPA: hypothetical protein VFW50_27040 [Streptosporangiaceae bacterium]|nr:hypothetical protein [Streptosporangiaceae bacterium]